MFKQFYGLTFNPFDKEIEIDKYEIPIMKFENLERLINHGSSFQPAPQNARGVNIE